MNSKYMIGGQWPNSSKRAAPSRVHPLLAKPTGKRAVIAAQQARDRPLMRLTIGALPTERNVGEYPTGERYAISAKSDVTCPCGCGYGLCARKMPDLHVPARALDVPAAPAAVEPRTFVVGQRVRFVGPKRFAGRDMTPGRDYTVMLVTEHCLRVTDDVGDVATVIATSFEPAPASAPPLASESEREWTPPAPFTETPPRTLGQARRWMTSAGEVAAIMHDGSVTSYNAAASPVRQASLAIACCAALSIELLPYTNVEGRERYCAMHDGSRLVLADDVESCARLALQAHHERSEQNGGAS